MTALKERAILYRKIRYYFDQRSVMEVETPILSSSATVDVYIDSFQAAFQPIGAKESRTYYLHTSPEFPMKRLLSAGSGDIYSLGKVFRNGEVGGRHNPEFTLLEWYRLGMDQQQLMDDVSNLLSFIACFKEVRRCSYGRLFEEQLGVNPHTATDQTLCTLVTEQVDAQLSHLDRNDCLDLLFSRLIEPTLGCAEKPDKLSGVFVYNYPATQSALARTRVDNEGQVVAARFELFINGVEVANGYHELLDADEQLKRFQKEQKKRQQRGLPQYPFDNRLVQALRHGMPDCAGVALGVDRLFMLMLQTDDISDAISFCFDKA